MVGQVGDVGDDLSPVVGLDDHRVFERFRILLPGGAHERHPARRHRLQADQAKRLVAAVGQSRRRRRVQHRQQVIREKRRDIPDVGVGVLLQGPGQAGDILDPGGQRGHPKAALRGKLEHLAAERFQAAPDQHPGRHAALLQLRHGRHRLVPSFIRAEAPDFEEKRRRVDRRPYRPHLGLADPGHHRPRNAVRDDDRVHPPAPHDVLHVAADRQQGAGERQLTPVDAVEREMVVGVPEQQATIAQPGEVERIRDQRHGVSDVPFLAQDDHCVSPRDRRLDEVFDHGVGKAAVEVRHLVVLAVVDAHRMVAADPLTPAMQP